MAIYELNEKVEARNPELSGLNIGHLNANGIYTRFSDERTEDGRYIESDIRHSITKYDLFGVTETKLSAKRKGSYWQKRVFHSKTPEGYTRRTEKRGLEGALLFM